MRQDARVVRQQVRTESADGPVPLLVLGPDLLPLGDKEIAKIRRRQVAVPMGEGPHPLRSPREIDCGRTRRCDVGRDTVQLSEELLRRLCCLVRGPEGDAERRGHPEGGRTAHGHPRNGLLDALVRAAHQHVAGQWEPRLVDDVDRRAARGLVDLPPERP